MPLYDKYEVRKKGEHTDPHARYFVLRYDKDPHAIPALKAYAESCRNSDSQLADEILNEIRHFFPTCRESSLVAFGLAILDGKYPNGGI